MKVNCDKCNKEFEMDIKIKKHVKGIEEVYFRCEYCKKKYISYYTDEGIRKQQKEIKYKYNKLSKSEDQEKILKEIKKLKKILKMDMDYLENKMKGTR